MDALLFKWLGVAGIELQFNQTTLIFDPFFSRPPLSKIFFGKIEPNPSAIEGKISNCDHIFITHAHYDHLMDVPIIAKKTAAQVYGSLNTCGLLERVGVHSNQIHPLSVGSKIQLDSIEIEIYPAQHLPVPGFKPGKLPSGLTFPQRMIDYRMDEHFSFLMETGNIRILNWSSSQADNVPTANILFLNCISSLKFLKQIIKQADPKLVIPIHWDDFFQPITKPIQPFYETPQLRWPPLRKINLVHYAEKIKSINPDIHVLTPNIFTTVNLLELLGNNVTTF